MMWLQASPIRDGDNDSISLTPSEVTKSVKMVLPGYKLGRVSLCADGSAAFDLPSAEVCVPQSHRAFHFENIHIDTLNLRLNDISWKHSRIVFCQAQARKLVEGYRRESAETSVDQFSVATGMPVLAKREKKDSAKA
jgi:hypothetical protein